MAQSGTISASRNNNRDTKIKILGLTQSSVSAPFNGDGYPVGSYTAQGTFGTSAATVGLYGSNDGGTTWFLVGATFTAPQSGSMIGTNNEIFELYQFQATTGGDGTTSINFYVFLSATFG